MMLYRVINIKTAAVRGPYQSKQRARNMVDKLDNEYGAYVHTIEFVSSVDGVTPVLDVADDLRGINRSGS